jgi:hypothetical protein
MRGFNEGLCGYFSYCYGKKMFADLPDLLLLKIYARGVSILQTWQSTGTSTAAKVGRRL